MKIYTQLEVIELLVSNNNQIMELIYKEKYFKIVGDKVLTYKKRYLLGDYVVSEKTFEEIIAEAKGKQ